MVEIVGGVEGTFDGAEQPLLVLLLRALGLTDVEAFELLADACVTVEWQAPDPFDRASHAYEDEHLHGAPETLRKGRTSKHDELLTT